MADARKFEAWEYPPKPRTRRADLGGLSLSSLGALSFDELGRFKQAGRFPDDYSKETLTYYAPHDPGLHAVIVWTILQATTSIAVNMYGFDDPHAAALIRRHTENRKVAVTLTLDRGQESGPAELAILERFNHDLIGNSIASAIPCVGRSATTSCSWSMGTT